jgi:hypothetical protein
MPTLTKRARGTEATQSQASEADCFGAVRIETVTAEIRTTARLGYHESKSGRIDLGVALRVANQIESHSSVIGQISNPGSRFSATSYRSEQVTGWRKTRHASNDARVPCLTVLAVVGTGRRTDCRPLRGCDSWPLPGCGNAHYTIPSYGRAVGIRCHLCHGIAMRCAVEPIGPGVPDTSRPGRL